MVLLTGTLVKQFLLILAKVEAPFDLTTTWKNGQHLKVSKGQMTQNSTTGSRKRVIRTCINITRQNIFIERHIQFILLH